MELKKHSGIVVSIAPCQQEGLGNPTIRPGSVWSLHILVVSAGFSPGTRISTVQRHAFSKVRLTGDSKLDICLSKYGYLSLCVSPPRCTLAP